MTTAARDLTQFDPDHLDRIADTLEQIHGPLPPGVRYQAAAAALAHVATSETDGGVCQ